MRPRGLVFPDEVNVAPGRLVLALDVLRRGIDEGAMPGTTFCAFRRGQMFLNEAIGTLDGARPVTNETIYDLASLTKPMATAASIVNLVERGLLTFNDSLPRFFGAGASHLDKVRIHHLLTHTSGLPAWIPCYNNGTGLDAAITVILNQPVAPAGTKYEYSCLGYILLGRIVEMVGEMTLDAYVREHIFIPLNLGDTTYLPDPSVHDRIAPTKSGEGPEHPDKENPITLQGVVHDGNARGIGGISGNAGLFGTARDVAVFGEAMRRGPSMTMTFGVTNAMRGNPSMFSPALSSSSLNEAVRRGPATTSLFAAPTYTHLLQNQIDPSIGSHSHMFFAQPNDFCPSGDLLSKQTVGHSGFTGTVLTIDPALELVVVVLTNRVYTDLDGAKWLATRRRFLNTLAASVF